MVQQQHTRPGPGRGEERRTELGAVGSGDVNVFGRKSLGGRQSHQTARQEAAEPSATWWHLQEISHMDSKGISSLTSGAGPCVPGSVARRPQGSGFWNTTSVGAQAPAVGSGIDRRLGRVNGRLGMVSWERADAESLCTMSMGVAHFGQRKRAPVTKLPSTPSNACHTDCSAEPA